MPQRPQVADQCARQRALAGTRCSGEPDGVGLRRSCGVGQPPDRSGVVAATFDQRQQSGQCTAVTGERRLEQLGRRAPAAESLQGPSVGDVHDFGDAVDPVAHDALDAGLQGLGRRRACSARPDQVDRSRCRSPRRRRGARCRRRRPEGPGGSLRWWLRPVHAWHRHSTSEPVRSIPSVGAVLFAHQGGWDEILLVARPDRGDRRLLALATWSTADVAGRQPEAPAGQIPRTRSIDAPTAARRPDEVVVATVDVVHPAIDGLALGGEAGDHHRGAGADVVGAHGRTRQAGNAAHDRMVAVGADVGAQPLQFLDVAEPTRDRGSR